jgi:uncharacterized protein (TIGR00369 family)
LHAGVVIAVVDSACGYAALTLMEEAAEVLTVELKVNLLAPATGESLLARGRVLRSGRTLTVCSGEAVAVADGTETIVATLLTTMMSVRGEGRRSKSPLSRGRNCPRPCKREAKAGEHRWVSVDPHPVNAPCSERQAVLVLSRPSSRSRERPG